MMQFLVIVLGIVVLSFTRCKSTEYLVPRSQFHHGFVLIQDSLGKYGVLDSNYKVFIPTIHQEILQNPFTGIYFDRRIVGKDQDTLTVYDLALDSIFKRPNQVINRPVLLPDQSYRVGPIQVKTANSVYYYNGNNNWGAIHENGDTIIPFHFFQITEIDGDFVCDSSKLPGYLPVLYSSLGQRLWKTTNVEIFPWGKNNEVLFSNRLFPETRYRHFLGDEIFDKDLPVEQHNILKVSHPYAWVQDSTGCYLMDSLHKRISPVYDSVVLNENWGALWQQGKIAFTDENNRLISSFEFIGKTTDYISDSRKIIGFRENGYIVLNADGETLFQHDYWFKIRPKKRLKSIYWSP